MLTRWRKSWFIYKKKKFEAKNKCIQNEATMKMLIGRDSKVAISPKELANLLSHRIDFIHSILAHSYLVYNMIFISHGLHYEYYASLRLAEGAHTHNTPTDNTHSWAEPSCVCAVCTVHVNSNVVNNIHFLCKISGEQVNECSNTACIYANESLTCMPTNAQSTTQNSSCALCMCILVRDCFLLCKKYIVSNTRINLTISRKVVVLSAFEMSWRRESGLYFMTDMKTLRYEYYSQSAGMLLAHMQWQTKDIFSFWTPFLFSV